MSKHILSVDQFKDEDIFDLFNRTDDMLLNGSSYSSLRGKIVGMLFLEPSTRTMSSFAAAVKRLGGDTIGWSGTSHMSMAKGESLEDTIKTMSQYVDIIVLRHSEKGASARAAAVSDVPIINAGDGDGEHPTQALLDLYTIADERNTDKNRHILDQPTTPLTHRDIDGLKILFFGDNKYARTVNSLKKLLGFFEGISMMEENLYFEPESFTGENGGEPIVKQEWDKENFIINLSQADVVYITRLQKERWPTGWHCFSNSASANHYAKYKHINKYIAFNASDLKWLKKDAIILHPLPRTDEMNPEVDSDKRCKIWRQAKNGMFLRMALLQSLLS